jgi:hypothetical protein
LVLESEVGSETRFSTAYHMLRAESCFRKQVGLEVLLAPCAFRTATFGEEIEDWVPNTSAIRKNEHHSA